MTESAAAKPWSAVSTGSSSNSPSRKKLDDCFFIIGNNNNNKSRSEEEKQQQQKVSGLYELSSQQLQHLYLCSLISGGGGAGFGEPRSPFMTLRKK